MNTEEFDYDAFLGGVDTLSNNTTSPMPTASEHDSDSGVAYTPSIPVDMDNTVINLDDFDLFPLNMGSPSTDGSNDDFNRFLDQLSKENPSIPIDNSTFESLFSDPSPQSVQELPQELSPSVPTLSPTPSVIPPITDCIKIQCYTPPVLSGTKIVKCEPKNPSPNPSIRIITTSKPLTLANVPVITIPLASNDALVKPANPITPPIAKRRRSDSPSEHQQVSEVPALTIEQLKRQYGNMSEEALKKHIRMIKNRESASLSRKRRKDLMENLDVTNKQLQDENEQLKQENSKLLIRIHTLELENKLLKQYTAGGNNPIPPPARKPLILMGIVLLVVFNVFTLKSLAPVSTDPSNSMALYNSEGAAIVPSRTILSNSRSNDASSYPGNSDDDYGPNGNNNVPSYPYIQCVAYINKTHSQRINQDLRSWVQDQSDKQLDSKPMIIPDPKSLTIPSNDVVQSPNDAVIEPIHHVTRKVARQTKHVSDSKGQLQPYKTYEANYDEFIHTLDRKNDTLYFVSFKRDHLILPATSQNHTQRPKMSLILPASMANLNKSIHIPNNHVPMIKIDCEVEDTKLVFVKRSHIPTSYRNELFQYYSSVPPASI